MGRRTVHPLICPRFVTPAHATDLAEAGRRLGHKKSGLQSNQQWPDGRRARLALRDPPTGCDLILSASNSRIVVFENHITPEMDTRHPRRAAAGFTLRIGRRRTNGGQNSGPSDYRPSRNVSGPLCAIATSNATIRALPDHRMRAPLGPAE
jgi:hypothetical protein